MEIRGTANIPDSSIEGGDHLTVTGVGVDDILSFYHLFRLFRLVTFQFDGFTVEYTKSHVRCSRLVLVPDFERILVYNFRDVVPYETITSFVDGLRYVSNWEITDTVNTYRRIGRLECHINKARVEDLASIQQLVRKFNIIYIRTESPYRDYPLVCDPHALFYDHANHPQLEYHNLVRSVVRLIIEHPTLVLTQYPIPPQRLIYTVTGDASYEEFLRYMEYIEGMGTVTTAQIIHGSNLIEYENHRFTWYAYQIRGDPTSLVRKCAHVAIYLSDILTLDQVAGLRELNHPSIHIARENGARFDYSGDSVSVFSALLVMPRFPWIVSKVRMRVGDTHSIPIQDYDNYDGFRMHIREFVTQMKNFNYFELVINIGPIRSLTWHDTTFSYTLGDGTQNTRLISDIQALMRGEYRFGGNLVRYRNSDVILRTLSRDDWATFERERQLEPISRYILSTQHIPNIRMLEVDEANAFRIAGLIEIVVYLTWIYRRTYSDGLSIRDLPAEIFGRLIGTLTGSDPWLTERRLLE